MNRGKVSLFAFLFAGVAVSEVVFAQVKPNATAADVGLYAGPDRLQKLIEGAKKEKELNLYTSAQSDDMGALAGAYGKKYGVKVNIWRASSEKVLQRAVAEARANRNTVDLVETNGPELESRHRENLLQRVESPHHADLIAPALRPHGEWVGTRLNVFVQAYNTKAVRKEDLPKTWEDLLASKWKGRLGIEAEDSDWLAGVLGDLGEVKGTKLFKEIVVETRYEPSRIVRILYNYYVHFRRRSDIAHACYDGLSEMLRECLIGKRKKKKRSRR